MVAPPPPLYFHIHLNTLMTERKNFLHVPAALCPFSVASRLLVCPYQTKNSSLCGFSVHLQVSVSAPLTASSERNKSNPHLLLGNLSSVLVQNRWDALASARQKSSQKHGGWKAYQQNGLPAKEGLTAALIKRLISWPLLWLQGEPETRLLALLPLLRDGRGRELSFQHPSPAITVRDRDFLQLFFLWIV